MVDEPSKRRRRWPAWVGWAVLVLVAAAGCMDYRAFHARKREVLAVVHDLGGRAGSIGGWPWGEDIAVSLPRGLSDAEIESLAVLNKLKGRRHVTVIFCCDLPEARLTEIKSRLDGCHVYAGTDRGARNQEDRTR